MNQLKRTLSNQEIQDYLLKQSPHKKIRNENDSIGEEAEPTTEQIRNEEKLQEVLSIDNIEKEAEATTERIRNEEELQEDSTIDDSDEDPTYSPPVKDNKKRRMGKQKGSEEQMGKSKKGEKDTKEQYKNGEKNTKKTVAQRKKIVNVEYFESSDVEEDESNIEFEGFHDTYDSYADVELQEVLENMRIEEEMEAEEEEGEETQTSSFDWQEFSTSRQPNFTFEEEEECGLLNPTREKTIITPQEAFDLFVTENLLNMIVEQTNLYGDALNAEALSKGTPKANARIKDWKRTNVEELKHFLGLVLWMGLVPLGSIPSYWSKNPLYNNFLAPKTMSRNRFELLLRCLHFADNSLNSESRLAKIEPLITHLQESFHNVLLPGEDVVIDETLVPWRGRLVFRQYIPNKAHKYGIKLFKLCSNAGYTYSFQVYTGMSQTGEREKNLAQNVCLKLMEGLLNKGRTLYVDNFYTTHSLATELLTNKTHVVGTVRRHRKVFPKDVMNAKLKKGQMVSKQDSNGIVILKWKDKRDVYLMSTKHEPSFAAVEETTMDDPNDTAVEDLEEPGPSTRGKKKKKIQKPIGIIAYNKGKAGIDLSDQLSSYATTLRKGVKWYRKLAMELLLGMCIVNAKVVYESINKKKVKIRNFRENLALHLLGLDVTTEQRTHEESHKLVKAKRTYCKSCYKKTANQSRELAKAKARRPETYCNQCKEQMCLECFFLLHNSKRI